jgi:hypothetical protein
MLHRKQIGWGIFVVGIGLAAFFLIALLSIGDGLIRGIGVAGAALLALLSVAVLRGILAARLVLDRDGIRMHNVGYRLEALWRDARLCEDGHGRPILRPLNPRVSFDWWLGMMAILSLQGRSSLDSIPLHGFATGWPDNALASAIRAFAPDLMEPSPGTTGRAA